MGLRIWDFLDWGFGTTGCAVRVTGYGVRDTRCGVRIAGYGFGFGASEI